ncbi:MAG TPA: DUF6443 domain-containing protein [Ohtaekwangia sp.]|uniref:DUF6443 domain-containing protein n=1 Tax=Ohtaekwangia sp. TaxID=2066019 RepID=UPI002F93696E
MKNIYLTAFFCFTFLVIKAQSIVGPAKVGLNSVHTYSYTNGSVIQSPKWTFTKGTITTSVSGTTYYANVTATSTGAGTLTLQDINGTITTYTITVNSCSAITAPVVNNGSHCGPGAVTLSTTTLPSGYLPRWYNTATPNLIAATGDDNTFTTPSLSATTTYYAAFVQNTTGCESSKVTATATILTPPTSNAGADQTGAATCGLTSVTLGATGTGSWTVVSGTGGSFGSTTNAASSFSGTAGSSYVLRWTVSDGTCTGTDDVAITLNQNPTAPNAGADQVGASTCGLTSVSLSANTPALGTGMWVIGSDCSAGGSLGNASSASTTFTGLAGGAYCVVWKTTYGVCVLNDEMLVTFNKIPSASNAGTDIAGAATCGMSSVTLAGNSPAIGTGIWSIASGTGGSFSNAGSPTATFTGTEGNTYALRWTISNGPCAVSTDDVTVQLSKNPTTANAGADLTGAATCGLTGIALAGNTPSAGTGSWTVVSGTGGSFSSASSAASTFSGTAGAAYTLRWTIANSPCPASTDDVNVTFNLTPNAAVATASQTICSGSTASFSITNPNNVSGTNFSWTTDSFNAAITPSTTSPGNSIAGSYSNADEVNAGTVTYTITPYTSACTGTPVTATVNINNIPTQPNPSTNLAYGHSAALFKILVPSGLQAQWYLFDNSPTPLSTGDTYQNTAFDDPDAYYISFKDIATLCESPRVPIMATRVSVISPVSVTKEVIRVQGQTYDGAIDQLNNTLQKAVTVSYMDGLSRTIQVIAKKASAQQNDLVQPVEYDAYGRASKTYLPYTISNTTGFQENYPIDQSAFYTTANDKVANDNFAFANTAYEASPLGRPLEQGSVGQDFQLGTGHTTTATYSYNAIAVSSDEVYKFTADPLAIGTGNDQHYADNTLVRTQTTDANGHKTITFTDALGRTLASKQQLDGTINSTTVDYLATYYIYDDLNHLRYIVPPGGIAAWKANNWVVTQAILDQHFHQFVYDSRGRLTQKKTPGQDWLYYGYDKLNRLVLMQDANLRPSNKWAFVKYDIQGRAVMTGLYTNTTATTLSAIQSLLDAQYSGSTIYYETRGTTLYGYTNQSFPTTNASGSALEVLNVNYFDDYDFDNNGTADYTYDAAHLSGLPTTATPYTRGQATGNRRLILGSTNWLIAAVFYDNFGRTIQTQTNNHLNLTTIDKSSVVYDFEGKVTQTKNDHNGGGANAVAIVQTPVYDALGKHISGIKHNINGGTDRLVAQYEFNELGQIVTKQLHNTGGSAFLQNVDYRYNVNGQLTTINNAQLTDDGGVTNHDTNDYFGMELLYNTSDASGLGNTPLYNGNVSAVKWKGIDNTSAASGQRSYTYSYDKTDKLQAAAFKQYGTTAWNQEQNTLNESIDYDYNGNILHLQRNQNQRGLSGTTVTSTAQLIDNLTYTYNNGNQLTKVTDATARSAGFSDGANATTEYSYDAHGNVTSDQNKGISAITYNVLGLAQQITFTDGRTISYTYDANGNKLKMTATVNSTTTVTDYVHGFVYTNNTMSYFGSPEGRIVKNGSNYEYQYAIADHQGNTRVVFSSVTPAASAPTATFEGDSNDGTSQYLNVNASNVVSFGSANHTSGGSKVIRVNQTYKTGPARSIHVYPGDQVDIEVWEYHEGTSGFGTTSTPLNTLITNIAGAFGGVSGAAGESGTIYNGVNAAITAFNTGGNQGDSRPAAYLNYILFDKNYNVLDAGWQLAPNTTFTKQKLSFPTKLIKTEGYIYTWLSYDDDSNNFVYFDDFTVTHTKTSVIQYNEYYPFGLQTADSWTRDNSSNNFLYNEGSELNQTSGFYDLPFRNYDASLGRFFQVDPLSYQDNATSPFAYAGNNPVVFTDPSGLMFSSLGLSDSQLRMLYRRDMASYLNYDDWASQNVIEYAAGKGFDAGGTGNMFGRWEITGVYMKGGRKPRYEPDGTGDPEYGFTWTYIPGTGRSPFDQVKSGPAETSGGKPQGNWGGTRPPGSISFIYTYRSEMNIPIVEFARTRINHSQSTLTEREDGSLHLEIHIDILFSVRYFENPDFLLANPDIEYEITAHELVHGLQLETIIEEMNFLDAVSTDERSGDDLKNYFYSLLDFVDLMLEDNKDKERDANERSSQFLPPDYDMKYNNGKVEIKLKW